MALSRSAPRVRGPHGELISIADLPEPGTRRWGPARKAYVVAAVEGGLITYAEVFARYDLSIDEYLAWRAQTVARGYPHLAWLSASAPSSKIGAPGSEQQMD
jgi:hypothetical protein